jgi:hypothetical protein
MLGVFLRLVLLEQRHDLPHHDVHGIVAHLLRDGDEPHAVLRELADVELKLEMSAEEARESVHDGAGLLVPASIMRWNSGRRSFVAEAPDST